MTLVIELQGDFENPEEDPSLDLGVGGLDRLPGGSRDLKSSLGVGQISRENSMSKSLEN